MEAILNAGAMAEWRIRNLPEQVRKALRLWAVEDDRSMNDLIISILTMAVDKKRRGK